MVLILITIICSAFSYAPADTVNEELEELDIFDSWTWEQQDSELILTTVTDSDVQEYSIPYADLQMDESNPEEDVQYIMKAITDGDSDKVTSATKIEASDKSVVIPPSAKTKYYQDIGGGFGDTDEVYSLEDLMIIWNSECNSDPTMSQYESFDDWWQDTKQWMKPSSKPAEEVDDEMFTDNDGVFGNPGDIISKRDMRTYYEENCDSDPSLMDYNSFEDWWSATQSMLTPVTNSTDVEASYDEVESDVWEELESKQVQDSDGFYTDYTLYKNMITGEYVCVFGDKDMYRPEDSDHDYECEDESEAYEWFESYNGFEDDVYTSTKVECGFMDDEDSDEIEEEELTPEGFYEMFSVSCEPELMEKAARILYEWYTNEGEEYMPDYLDVLDMCDAADDLDEKRIVLEALGEWFDDEDDEIDASEDVKCATVADNGEQVFQLMEYSSDPEAGIEGDDFYCYGEFFAIDEDDALKQLEEAKSAYPEFANLADQAHLFVQPYNEHFSTEGEIYQNVSAIAQHLNQDFHDDEIPFA